MMILSSALIAVLFLLQTIISAESIKKNPTGDQIPSEDISIPIIAVDVISRESDEFSDSPTIEAYEPLYLEEIVQTSQKPNHEDPSQNDVLNSPEPRGSSDKREEYYDELAKKAENAFPSLRPLKFKPDSKDEEQAGASASDFYVPRPSLDIKNFYKPNYDEIFPTFRNLDRSKRARNFGFDSSAEFTPKRGFSSGGYDMNDPRSFERTPKGSSDVDSPYVDTKSEYYKPSNPEPYSNSEYYKSSKEEEYPKEDSYKSSKPDSYIKSEFYRSTPDLYKPAYFKSSNPNAYSMSDYYKSPNPDAHLEPNNYKEQNPDAYSKPDYYKEPTPDTYSKPEYYKSPNSDVYSKPEFYKSPNPDAYSKPDFYKAPNPDVYSNPSHYKAPTPEIYSSSEYFKPINSDNFSKPSFRKSAFPNIAPGPTYHRTSNLPQKYRSRSRNAASKPHNSPVSSRNTKTSSPVSSYPKTSVKRPRIGSRKRYSTRPSDEIHGRQNDYFENDYTSKPPTAHKTEKRTVAPILGSEEGRLFLAGANYGKPVREQFHEQGTEGAHSYKFGYNTGDKDNPMARYEERDADGLVKGSYSFVDAMGQLKVVKYESHPVFGFRTTAS
ncbi:uncharacterized protein [Parasteatoda tepidariorum]|uniref:uncharacterized protein n=1 Tax=Parasteatoda tepidariorum TaxID=114398 RepID=UPI00077F8487|nr:uncharacterized protein LOC107457397 [Parasteatoda tepidariorum]